MDKPPARQVSRQSASERWYLRLFRVGIVVKGINGVIETVTGLLFLTVGRTTLTWSVFNLTQHRLLQDPDDRLAHSLRHAFSHFSAGNKLFATIYLLLHGVLKIFLMVSLLREHLWAFPTGMAVLGGFMIYQGYHLATNFSWLLLSLAGLDCIILLLIWHEYRNLKRRKPVG
jgi:uncharacterized membrane protein